MRIQKWFVIGVVALIFLFPQVVQAAPFNIILTHSSTATRRGEVTVKLELDVGDPTNNQTVTTVLDLGLPSETVWQETLTGGKMQAEKVYYLIDGRTEPATVSLAIGDTVYLYKKSYITASIIYTLEDTPVGQYVGGTFNLSAETAPLVAQEVTQEAVSIPTDTTLLDDTGVAENIFLVYIAGTSCLLIYCRRKRMMVSTLKSSLQNSVY